MMISATAQAYLSDMIEGFSRWLAGMGVAIESQKTTVWKSVKAMQKDICTPSN